MTKIKLCGLSREADVLAANDLMPEYVGFVFAKNSRRYVTPNKAAKLRSVLDPNISAVGVFVNEEIRNVASLLVKGIINIAQLHGDEDDDYIAELRSISGCQIIKAFRVTCADDIIAAKHSNADYILLDSGSGTGKLFDWNIISCMDRPYFLAGGLDSATAAEAVTTLNPYAVDVSSGIETSGYKDKHKMQCFVHAVRGVGGKDKK